MLSVLCLGAREGASGIASDGSGAGRYRSRLLQARKSWFAAFSYANLAEAAVIGAMITGNQPSLRGGIVRNVD